ncbi:hypothetical protein BCR34DRAFT_605991 [Clohesyomyces aquaticus]|uniref:Uncharacterized protein n=1 Tax=Clohesyomyces aquaticus TaxID=1231657 RepID=A0A1Y1YUN6_9PLEO|nr:hypothetical protein BCR34DRAFT_605991 [Clohesyomyces aquaticus]
MKLALVIAAALAALATAVPTEPNIADIDELSIENTDMGTCDACNQFFKNWRVLLEARVIHCWAQFCDDSCLIYVCQQYKFCKEQCGYTKC